MVGSARDSALTNGRTAAVRWNASTGLAALDLVRDGGFSMATAVNHDGSVIVGGSNNGAFRWTNATGMASLGFLNNGFYSGANGVSADGNTIVGDATDGSLVNASRAFRWTQADGMQSLGVLPGTARSFGLAISADGNTLAGFTTDGTGSNQTAFRWTAQSGMVTLGRLPGWNTSIPKGLSRDGMIIVGWAQLPSGDFTAFRWTASQGLHSIESWLRANGVTVGQSFAQTAVGISADGSTIVGGTANGSYVARVSALGSGAISLADLTKSLEGRAFAGNFALSSTWLVLSGAHSTPLAKRVAAGRSGFWVAGDMGRMQSEGRAGPSGLAEVGLGRNFGTWQLNAAIGQTYMRQEVNLGARIRSDGAYVLAEGLVPLGSVDGAGPWAILGGYYHSGTTAIARSYFNAGTPDSSDGGAPTNSWGVRARLEWENVFRHRSLALSPFLQFNMNSARMKAYAESGGGFPVNYETRKETTREFHAGVSATIPLGMPRARLIGVAEYARRSEGSAAPTMGTVPGLFGFNIPGGSLQREWRRFGAGAELPLGSGTASLMANTTSRRDAPGWWLAASWRTSF